VQAPRVARALDRGGKPDVRGQGGGHSPEGRVVHLARAGDDVRRQTPHVSITVWRTALARRHLGRSELKPFSYWDDGRPETELNSKFYRQAIGKIVGMPDGAAALLQRLF
jgi:hypothetical protein